MSRKVRLSPVVHRLCYYWTAIAFRRAEVIFFSLFFFFSCLWKKSNFLSVSWGSGSNVNDFLSISVPLPLRIGGRGPTFIFPRPIPAPLIFQLSYETLLLLNLELLCCWLLISNRRSHSAPQHFNTLSTHGADQSGFSVLTPQPINGSPSLWSSNYDRWLNTRAFVMAKHPCVDVALLF